MDTKLTLKLDKRIIDKVKLFAKKNNTSLSNLVENYFDSLINKANNQVTLSPTVKSLAGVFKIKGKTDIHALRDQYLLDKYHHE